MFTTEKTSLKEQTCFQYDLESESDDDGPVASRTRIKATNTHVKHVNRTNRFVHEHDNETERHQTNFTVKWNNGSVVVEECDAGNVAEEALRPDMRETLLENVEMIRQANNTCMESLAEEGGRSALPSVRFIQKNPHSEMAKAWNEAPK